MSSCVHDSSTSTRTCGKKRKKKENDNDNTLYNHMSHVAGESIQCSSLEARIGCAVIAQPIGVFISLHRYPSPFWVRGCNPVYHLCCAAWVVSNMVGQTEDMFARDVAHYVSALR